jgi:TATA-box binding protein (TBP) (component of TFIID and TFIIIB)
MRFTKDNLLFDLIVLEVTKGLEPLLEGIDIPEKKAIFEEFTRNLSGLIDTVTYEDSLTYLSTQPNIFLDNKFQVVNMMVKCKIRCVDKPNFFFDLEKLKKKDDEMYYSSDSVPSMMMPFGVQSCTARVTTSGFVTMTGGKSVKEIIHWLSMFVYKLLYYLTTYTKDMSFYISDFKVHNKVCRCRIPYKVNLNGMGEFLKTTELDFTTRVDKKRNSSAIKVVNISTSGQEEEGGGKVITSNTKVNYNPDKICLIYVQMMNVNGRKVTFSIGPDGGIMVLAYLHNYEILLLSYGLTKILTPHLVPNLIVSSPKRQEKPPSVKPPRRKIKNNEKWKRMTTKSAYVKPIIPET